MSTWAVVVAAASVFMLGGLWYSPKLFGYAWDRANGYGGPRSHSAAVFVFSFIFALISAWAFARLLGPDPTLGASLRLGLFVGVGFTATSFGINYQFAERSMVLWLIDGGYHVCQFLLFGLIFGLWP